MYYRYEARNKSGEFEGIFSFFNSFERRYFNRFLKEPKWYSTGNNSELNSQCWFTEEGYKKYHHIVDEIIESKNKWGYSKIEVRLLTQEKLSNIVCKGKIQCVTLL